MNEHQQITQAFRDAHDRGEAVALATVVEVRGSAYRRPGARMLVTDDGQRIGHISGGCLERDVSRLASSVIRKGDTALRLYDSLDEDLADGFALGCNGAVLILVEPANANVQHLIEFQRECLERRCRGAIATVYSSPDVATVNIGARVSTIDGQSRRSSGVEATNVEDMLGEAVATALSERKNGTWSMATEKGTIKAFIELINPPLRVMIFGAGHDAAPLVSFGHELGWSMQVVANAGGYGVRERFRKAESLYVGTPQQAVASLRPDGDTIALLMSHNFPSDVDAFCALAPARPFYIGLLGPWHRAIRLIETAQARGTVVDDALRERVFGPVGLDIGAETPVEVALSIVSEINATIRGRNGRSTRLLKASLHAPGDEIA